MPPPVDPGALPEAVRDLLLREEQVYYFAQPIRPAQGMGVWLIFALGVVFLVPSVGALKETMRSSLAAEGMKLLVGGLLSLLAFGFFAFSLFLLAFPWLMRARLGRTFVLITERRVLEVLLPRRKGRPPRLRSFPLAECTDPSVARRRGAAATLVLRERLRERKTDGQTVYEWEALHGLPRAD